MQVNFLMVNCGPLPPVRHGGIEWVVYLYALGMHRLGHEINIIYENYFLDGKFKRSDFNLSKVKGPLIIQNFGQLSFLKDKGYVFTGQEVHLLHWRSPAICNHVISPSRYCSVLPRMQVKSVERIPHPVYDTSITDLFNEHSVSTSLHFDSKLYDRDYLFVAARLCDFKNVKRCIKVANALKTKLIWAGPVEDHKLMEDLLSYGHEYVGNLPRTDVLLLMKNATAVLCLTKYFPVGEAYGLFQVEAFLAGAKVITSRSGGLFDTVFKPNSFTLPHFMPMALAENKLKSFIQQDRCDLSEAYVKQYSADTAARRLTTALQKIAQYD